MNYLVYSALHWDAKKLALVTLTPGQCAWLAGDQFGVHKVHCPMGGGRKAVGLGNQLNKTSNYAATLHAYLNEHEVAPGIYTASVQAPEKSFRSSTRKHVNEGTLLLTPISPGTFYAAFWPTIQRIETDVPAVM